MKRSEKPANIDVFISQYPKEVQAVMQQIRETIQKACPEAKEKISYGIPTFTFHGNLVHFSAYDTYIGFYPGSAPIITLKDELKPYETSKGTVRFPIDQPIPYALIAKLTKAAVDRNLSKGK
jgi:uncharacterized protein YdhG (YjbR/CyaY superfamily)